MPYQSTKTFGHELGLSCAFRQWRAQSHCRLLHGYALSFKLVFESHRLDDHHWVVDFGSLAPVKEQLKAMFDHTLLVAQDDPEKEALLALDNLGLAKVVVVDAVGCEATARRVFEWVEDWLVSVGHSGRVRLLSVEVAEHPANSSVYRA